MSLEDARLHLRKVEGGIILLEAERSILAAAVERLSEKKDDGNTDNNFITDRMEIDVPLLMIHQKLNIGTVGLLKPLLRREALTLLRLEMTFPHHPRVKTNQGI